MEDPVQRKWIISTVHDANHFGINRTNDMTAKSREESYLNLCRCNWQLSTSCVLKWHHTCLSVKVPSVQQQRGYTSCGLFAIAFAFHAARGDDLTKISFHQDKMRQHLAKCFKTDTLHHFPTVFLPKATVKIIL